MKKILLIIFLIALVTFLGAQYYREYFNYRSFQKTSLTPAGISRLRKEMTRMVTDMGPQTAYAALKDRYSTSDEAIEPHNGAHLFGEVLYDQGGYENIKVCDETFEWGCYHGIFIRAMQASGPAAIEKFFQSCRELTQDALSCQHGIGHALGQYFSPDELLHQLDICDGYGWHTAFGCGGGVFMEYNLPHWFGSGAPTAKPRAMNSDDPFYPCFDLPEKYRSGCVFRLGEWWIEYVGKDLTRADGYCDKLADPILKKDCWVGVGQAVVELFNSNADEVIAGCEKLGSYESKFLCRAGASWVFQITDNEPDSQKICSGYPGCLEEVTASRQRLEL